MSNRARQDEEKTDSGPLSYKRMVECDRAEFLSTQIEELLGLSDDALECEQLSAAVAAKAKAAELRAELDKLKAYDADSKVKRTPLEEVRAMRQRADAAGSHVAALNLLKVELELQEKAEAAERAAAQERLAHLTTDQRMQMLIAAVAGLPSELREQLHHAVFAPVH